MSKDQYRIPTTPVVPGEVIKTYDLSDTLTAEQALDIARAVAGETRPLDTDNIDQRRSERFGAATVSTVEVPAVAAPEVIDLSPQALVGVGARVTGMREWELAA